MKTSYLLLLGALCLAAQTASAKKLAPPQSPGWRNASANAAAQTFKPVLEKDSIRFGSKIIKLQLDGGVMCMSEEYGPLFTMGMPFYHVQKNGQHFDWGLNSVDRKKSKIIRNGNKYTWEIWFKRGNIKPFRGILQTLEVLPDGRLLLTSSYQLPKDLKEYKLSPWTPGFSLLNAQWENETVNMDGKVKKFDKTFKKDRTAWNQKKMNWIFSEKNPAKRFSIQADIGGNGGIGIASIYRQSWGKKHIQVRFNPPKSKVYKLYFDFTKGLASGSMGESRGGVNFTAIENMTLPYIRNKNMVTNPSLECNTEGWHSPFSTRMEYKWYEPIKLDSSTAYDGKYSMQFTTGWTNWSTISPIMGPIRVIAEPGYYTASFYAKAEPGEKDTLVALWISDFHTRTRAGRPLQNKCEWKFRITPEWRRYQATFYVPKGCPTIHLSFYGYRKGGEKKFWVDAVQMEKGKKATAYAPHPVEGGLFTSSPDNFISSKDKINGRFVITTAKPEDEGTVKITVSNFFGEKLLELNRKFKTGSDRKAEIKLPLDDIQALGVFVVKAEYKLKNGKTYYDYRRYAKIEFQDMPRPNKRMFSFSYSPNEVRYEFLKQLERLKVLGVGSQHWMHTTDKKIWDVYSSYGVEPFFSSMLSYKYRSATNPKTYFYIHDGIRKSGLGGTNQPIPNTLIKDFHKEAGGKITPEYQEKLKNAVKKQVSQSMHVPTWALCGEITCKLHNDWWGKNYTDHDVARCIAKLMQSFVAGVKEANPKAKVCSELPSNMGQSSGIAEMDRVLGECNKLGVKFDIIGIHTYRYSPENPDLDADTAYLLKMLDRRGYSKAPIVWSEGMHWGPFDIPQWGTRSVSWQHTPITWHGLISYDMGWTEKKSAAWYARSWLVGLKYGDRIIGATAGSTASNCFMDMQLTPYAAQLVSNTLCCILGDAKFKKDIRFAPYIRTYIFEDAQKRPVAVVWNHHENVDGGKIDAPMVNVKLGNWMESIRDLMNTERTFTRGNMRFAATPFPLFFRGKPGTLKQMISAFEKAEPDSGDTFKPLTVSVLPASTDALNIKVKNTVSNEFSGTMNSKKLKVPASGETVIKEAFPGKIRTDRITHVKRNFTLKTDSGRTYNYTNDFTAFAIKKVAEGTTLDTIDWSKLPAIDMKKKPGVRTSGKFRMAWNKTTLFLEVKIKDPKFVHVEFKNPQDRWNNDCLQVFFDTFANARDQVNKGYDMDDYDYAVFPNSKGTAAQVFRYRTVETQLGLATLAPPDKTFAPDMPCTFSYKNGVQTYRVAFPGKYLLPIRLQKGWVFGFGLFSMDAVAVKKLNGFLTIASDNQGCHNRPHTWPAVILSE